MSARSQLLLRRFAINSVIEKAMPIIEDVVTALGYELVDVEYKTLYGDKHLIVYIASEKGVSLDDCETVSNALDAPLDALDPTSSMPYCLDVSSSGLDRPFKSQRDYERNYGSKVEVKLFAPIDGSKQKLYVGTLVERTDSAVTIETDGVNTSIENGKIALVEMAKKSSTLTLQADFYDALSDLETERGIKKEVFIDALQDALTSAYKKQYGVPKAIKIIMMPEFKKFEIHTCQKVVEQVEERETEISLEDARLIDKKYKVGDEILGPVDAAEFGRIVAQMAKQIVTQKLRAVESEKAYSELSEKEEQLVTCIVHRIDGKNVCVEIQKMEAVLYPKDQLPGDKFKVGDKIKVFVRGIKTTTRGPQVLVTRTAPGFVRKLFELEVPEIASGVVAIKGIVREAGLRTKMAVYATDSGVDAVGACVGNRGARVNSIISEVGGEKIDIIPWHEDPLEYIARALLPAKVVMVEAKEDERVARVVVMDDQLSLAIGREGVNARLAAKLTGWKIDIKPYSAMEQEVKAATERAEQMGSDNFDVFDEDLGELD